MITYATAEQIRFYEQVLYPLQDVVLADSHITPFYLTGGTALSRFYYHHRYSDDLDLFCDGTIYSKEDFSAYFAKMINSIQPHFDRVEMTINGDFFKRLFVYKDETGLKIEFVYEAYKTIGEKKRVGSFFLDTRENIATNKITAISGRNTMKDYIDLYYLLGDLSFEDLTKWAEYKMVPLDYESAVISFKHTVSCLEGDIVLAGKINEEDFFGFVENLAKKMIDHAKSRK